MAKDAYLTLKSATQGQIKGPVNQNGREDSIKVLAVRHSLSSAADGASGKPVHSPIVITKDLDKTTPLLYGAFVNGEIFTEWTLGYWQPDPMQSGQEVQCYTVRLENATIVGIENEMRNTMDPEDKDHPAREHVSFAYQAIRWTWEDGGMEASDTLSGPVDVKGDLSELVDESGTKMDEAVTSMQKALDEMGNPAGALGRSVSSLSVVLRRIQAMCPMARREVAQAENTLNAIRGELDHTVQEQRKTVQAMSNASKRLHDTATLVINKIAGTEH